MINIELLLGLLLLGVVAQAQSLTDCQACATTRYQAADIADNQLWELQRLRNEIFARHQYTFNNQRLSEYFEQFDWYQPSAKSVDLNPTEQHNVQLFKARETTIKTERQHQLQALAAFKTALEENNRPAIEAIFDPALAEDEQLYTQLLTTLKAIFAVVDLENIHWHKGRGLYEVTIDNGRKKVIQSLSIAGEEVVIMSSNPSGHSRLMKDDAFEYPSSYYSEDEYTSGVQLEWAKGKLKVVQLILVG